ncbi:sigma-70 family RNA polymerase sigma factor [Pseudobacter ginsenosidimutans]|uniref:RNA polymerase sigma-70 factor (ECF subfamily) n=1 Tax=Pseudobacter ginsenosidimutans TaxID=661488 RepID=A0A4Q7ML67_9BACT|nr:sigma-70 family RNA polymerase sigma factor [Pseudobacter ginsenosidimutans]QEC40362.1 sigma-70 family RNA polymerase sigma factor [Pseudobacter ginsenosidimutans]RZS69034.1 RNA polymerase sigma-70 factor (ECF subfamily) [Pseudobacter ginsenosidimutans]
MTDALRPLLTTYAYNILGSLHDAKDIVQDAYLKFMQANTEHIENKKAYLVRTVINLAINLKNRQQQLIDSYPGEWLPEMVATDAADTILNKKDVLSYSLLVLLEKLNPKERAVFILKEAFDYEHEEIAQALDLTVENSRKLLSRAKSKLREPAPQADSTVPADYVSKYMEVIRNGDTSKLEQLLHKDIVVISDGGGKAVAFRNPVAGIQNVAKLLMAIKHKYYAQFREVQKEINHQPALFYYQGDELVTAMVFVIENGQLLNVYFMRNPDKLKILQESL